MANEFPEGKENYCPRCYFEDDLTVLRSECKHFKSAHVDSATEMFKALGVKVVDVSTKCDCKNKYCKHYESDFDRFSKENTL